MELDPRILIVASVLSAVLLGSVSIAFAAMRGSSRVIGAWGVAMLMLAGGMTGLALRGLIPDWISIAVANTLVVAALVVGLRSLRRFLGSAPRDLLGWGLTGALFLYLLLYSVVWPSNVARTVAISTAVAIMAVRAALLLRHDAPAACRLSCRFTEIAFWATAAMTAARGVSILILPSDNVMAPAPLNVATFMLYAAFIVVGTLGVMWMEIESLQGDLVRSAHYDSLTGIYNRGTFLEECARELSRCARGGPGFSLAVFDLDHFKLVNDRYGHPVGDRVLKSFAEVLRASIRKHDTVGRYGGEEFALLMPNTGKDTAARVAERVRREVETRGVMAEGRRIEVTVSGGVAAYGTDGEDWDALLSAADTALYTAKDGGRNRIVIARTPGKA